MSAVAQAPAEIKAAWRQLARQNHPDLTGDDPAASQSATRRMAEINDAYESLTRIAAEEANGTAGGAERTSFDTETAARRSGSAATEADAAR